MTAHTYTLCFMVLVAKKKKIVLYQEYVTWKNVFEEMQGPGFDEWLHDLLTRSMYLGSMHFPWVQYRVVLTLCRWVSKSQGLYLRHQAGTWQALGKWPVSGFCVVCISVSLLGRQWALSDKSADLLCVCVGGGADVAGRGTPSRAKLGFGLTLGNELSEETHVLTKQETLLGKGTWMESSRVREPRRTALPRGSRSWVLWWWG